MENIVESLNIIYKTIELLIELDHIDLDDEHKKMINQAIDNLEESRRLLFHEKNRIRGVES